jgi:hypothetical protein
MQVARGWLSPDRSVTLNGMKRRGKRIAFTVEATGIVVVLVLGILYRHVVSAHLAAWWFQLSHETRTYAASSRPVGSNDWIDDLLKEAGGSPVILAAEDAEAMQRHDPPFGAWLLIDQRFPWRAVIVIPYEDTAKLSVPRCYAAFISEEAIPDDTPAAE